MSQPGATSADETWMIRQSWLAWHVLSYITHDVMVKAKAFETLFQSPFTTSNFQMLQITFQIRMAYLRKMVNHSISIRKANFQLNRSTSHIHQNYYCLKRWKKTPKPKLKQVVEHKTCNPELEWQCIFIIQDHEFSWECNLHDHLLCKMSILHVFQGNQSYIAYTANYNLHWIHFDSGPFHD